MQKRKKKNFELRLRKTRKKGVTRLFIKQSVLRIIDFWILNFELFSKVKKKIFFELQLRKPRKKGMTRLFIE